MERKFDYHSDGSVPRKKAQLFPKVFSNRGLLLA